MCGRMVLTRSAKEIADTFDLAEGETGFEWAPRYNVAPTQDVVAIRSDRAGRPRASLVHWGLIPSWAKERAIGNRMINARSETAQEKPAFRDALRRRRCIVPADGFYEWLRPAPVPGEKKRPASIPHLFTASAGGVLPIAGLWERWTDRATGEVVDSCTLLTTEANVDVSPIHHRMPVILAKEHFALWLDRGVETGPAVDALLAPASGGTLAVTRVGTQVNNARYDEPDCLVPVV